jgi:hypothetical protein
MVRGIYMDNLTMRKVVVLLGTGHSIQRGENSASLLFKSVLNNECEKHNVIAIAEEIDQDRKTIGYKLAAEQNYRHLYADPGHKERRARGIPSCGDNWKEIVNEFSQQYPELADIWPTDPPPINENDVPQEVWIAYNEKIQQSFRLREKIWLENIERLNLWPLLFVCGANHFDEFKKLLISSGFQVIQSHNYWEPKNP